MSNGARIYRDRDQVIPYKTLTKLVFTHIRYDDGLFNLEEPTRLTCKEDGIYLISAEVIWECFPEGLRQLTLRYNNTWIIATDRRQDCEGYSAFNTCVTLWEMKVGDFVEAEVFWWNSRVEQYSRYLPLEIRVKRARHKDSPEFMIQKVG